MANSVVLLKFPENPGRFRIEGIDFTKNVDHLRRLVANKISLSASEFDLIYCGRCLRDEKTINSYGVRPGVTVHALRRKDPEIGMEAEPMSEAEIQQLLTALHSAIMNPTQRQMVLKILTNREMLDNVIAATPCLQTDPEALAMLQDPELLIQLADPKMVQKIVRVHPSLGQAALHLAAAVNEESANQRTGGGSIFGSFSDDDMETAEVSTPSTSRGASQQAATSGSQSITSAQLAAALASAGAGTPQTSATTSTGDTGSGSASNRNQNAITADIFSQAMAQALASSAQSGGQSSSTTEAAGAAGTGRPSELQAQLQQLRDMGITDDQRSIRALQATGGDVQAALDLIFEGHL